MTRIQFSKNRRGGPKPAPGYVYSYCVHLLPATNYAGCFDCGSGTGSGLSFARRLPVADAFRLRKER